MRSWGGAAILLGAAVGATAALALRENTTPPAPPRAQSAKPSAAPRSPPPAPSARADTAGVPSSTQTAAEPGAATGTASARGASASPAPSAAPFPLPAPLPPATSTAEVEQAEIRCYEVDPEECGRAADAYDTGVLVRHDAEHALQLRKVELTRLVRACEKRSPHACFVLAGRYESGQGVDENDKHALGLLEHARDLCRRGAKKAECDGGEPK